MNTWKKSAFVNAVVRCLGMRTGRNRILMMILALCLLTGCSYATPVPVEESTDNGPSTLGLDPEFTYEVPRSLPGILVDQVGYDTDSRKIAFFLGEILPDQFRIIEEESGNCVYEGEIESRGYDELAGSFVSYGEFDDFAVPGRYYIEADMVGQSYVFQIEKEPYDEVFDMVLRRYYFNRCGVTLSTDLAGSLAHNACHTKEAQMKDQADVKLDVSGGWHMDEKGNRDVVKGCQTVNSLLLAYELHPDVFNDFLKIPESSNQIPDLLDEVRYEIDWLIKMQDTVSGAVYSSVSVADSKTGGYILYVDGITMDATIQYAATMAKFSYLYQTYDREFATVCLKAADRAYRYAEKYLSDVAEEEYFYAATELYRATGGYGYRNTIDTYLIKEQSVDLSKDFIFWGVVTYLSTKQRVDLNLCSTYMKYLMQDVEQISYAAKTCKLLVSLDKENNSNADMLQNMAHLAVVDHIITNHEYAMVLENHLHYLLGRNRESVSYLDQTGTRSYTETDIKQGVTNQIDLNAELVLMMSAILDRQSIIGEE